MGALLAYNPGSALTYNNGGVVIEDITNAPDQDKSTKVISTSPSSNPRNFTAISEEERTQRVDKCKTLVSRSIVKINLLCSFLMQLLNNNDISINQLTDDVTNAGREGAEAADVVDKLYNGGRSFKKIISNVLMSIAQIINAIFSFLP